jgi:serine/threonine protein kinase
MEKIKTQIKTKKKKSRLSGGENNSPNTLIGGKKLGEGGYGCVVKPAIPCSKTKLGANEISKIIHVRNKDDYNEELAINMKLYKADPNQKYLLVIKQECLLDINSALSRYPTDFVEATFYDKKGKEYTIINSKNKKLSKEDIKDNYCKIDRTRAPRNIIMDYGGEDLVDIYSRVYSHNYNLCKKYALYIFKCILKGIKIMHQNKIAHRDIKPENLIFLAVKKKHKRTGKILEVPHVRVIDFGLAQDVTHLDKSILDQDSVSVRGTSGYRPVDIDILQNIGLYSTHYDIDEPVVKERTLEEALDVFTDDKLSTAYYHTKKNMKVDSDYVKDSAKEKRRKLILATADSKKIFEKLKRELKTGILPAKYFTELDGYIYKSDIFALGVTFQRISKKLEVLDNKLFDLIQQMTQFDPDNRPNINQCLAHPVFKTRDAKSI